MDIDLTDVEPEKIGKGGGDYFPQGQFHVQVDDLQEWAGRSNDQTLVILQCLASNLPNMEARKHNEYFAMSAKAIPRLLQLAIACRLTTREDLENQKKTTGKAEIPWDQIAGRQCVITENEEHEGKVRAKVNFNIYDVDDPKVSQVPKNAGFLDRFYKMTGGPRREIAGGNGAAPAVQTPAKPIESNDDLFA
jgi:hypothetical protein